MSYPQYRYGFLEGLFGVRNGKAPVQSNGFVEAMQGRLVTFPNLHQHRVEPFELEDKSKPGFRRILAFFLVSPKHYIASTKWIPPQQMPVVADAVDAALRANLPREVSLLVAEGLRPGLMTQEEADKHAAVFMDERREADGGWRAMNNVSFCEH
jgi:hypothetical protein